MWIKRRLFEQLFEAYMQLQSELEGERERIRGLVDENLELKAEAQADYARIERLEGDIADWREAAKLLDDGNATLRRKLISAIKAHDRDRIDREPPGPVAPGEEFVPGTILPFNRPRPPDPKITA